MISRALIEEKIDNTHFKVRIPTINKVQSAVGSTPTSELAVATVCCLPGYIPSFKKGQVVFVCYEENDFSKPVILGNLFTETVKDNVNSDLKVESITASVNAKLPKDTVIGDIKSSEISQLKGIETNIQFSLDENNSKHLEMLNELSIIKDQLFAIDYEDEIEALHKTDESLQAESDKQQKLIDTNTTNIQKNETAISNHDIELTNIENRLDGPTIFNKACYGTSNPPTGPNIKEGQVYIKIE